MNASKSQPELRLTGGYLPKDQRIRVAREIRRTHFQLGGSGLGYETTHQTHYTSPTALSNPASQEHIKNIRKSHFSIGPTDAKANTLSEFKAKYPEHDIGSAAVSISQETRADLRKHHFELGHSQSAMLSTTQGAFKPQTQAVDAQRQKRVQMQRQNIRKHNFEFGTDQAPLVSITQQDYGYKTTEGWGADEKLKQYKGDLRTSHFQVGGTSQTYVSTAMKDYNLKQATFSAPAQMHLRQAHFQLGSTSQPMASTQQLDFVHRGEGKQQLNADKLNDLRSSHFVLGGDQVSYVPVSHSTHVPQPMVAIAPITDVGLRKSHFKLGDEGNSWTTVYQRTHLGRSDAAQIQAQRDRNVDKASHLTVGNDPAVMVSTSQVAFRPHTSAEAGKLDPAMAKDLRKSHFALGPGGNQYKPISKDYTGARAEPGRIDPELEKDLRSHHFTYGQDGSGYVTRNQADFKPRPSDRTQLDPSLMKNLRRSHFEIGDGPRKWGTEYRGNYHWVQPVEDKGYRFTFE